MDRESHGDEDEDVEVGEEGPLDMGDGRQEGYKDPGEDGVGEQRDDEEAVGEYSSSPHGCSHRKVSPQPTSESNLGTGALVCRLLSEARE